MKLDPSVLARIQFAFTVSFHIMFPTMSIGLASFLAVMVKKKHVPRMVAPVAPAARRKFFMLLIIRPSRCSEVDQNLYPAHSAQ